MQPTGIQPAQLLMEVVASAKDKIGQNIASSEFSQQLYEQHQLVQNASPGASAATLLQHLNATPNSSTTSNELSSAQSSGNGTKPAETNSAAGKVIKGSALASATAKNLVVSRWKSSQELKFTDSIALEKVLAQYQLSPSVTTAIRDALDEHGRISLQKLNRVLDRASAATTEAPPEGKAAAEEIQSLLATVRQQDQPIQYPEEVAIKSQGAYDFGAFRDLLRRLVDQVARANVKQSQKSSVAQTSTTPPAATNSTATVTSLSRATLPNQTRSLAANLIPSFLRDEKKSSTEQTSHAPAVASAAPDDGPAPQTEIQAAVWIGDQEEPAKSQQNIDQSNGTVNSFASSEAQSATSWLSGMSEWPQALQEMISEIVRKAPSESASSQIAEAEPVLTAAPAPPTSTAGGLAGQITSNPDVAPIDVQTLFAAAASTSATTANAGATTFWAMRSDTPEAEFSLEANPPERILSGGSFIPVVEKIAAPAPLNFTASDAGTSESRNSLSNSHSMPPQQDAFNPAGALGRSVFSAYQPAGSPGHPESTSENLTGLFMAAAATAAPESNTRPSAAMSSKPAEPKTVFNDVTRVQLTTPAVMAGTEAAVSQPGETQISAETPSTPNRFQNTLARAQSGEDTATPRTTNTEQPEKAVQNHPASEPQSQDGASSFPLSDDLSSLRETLAKSPRTPVEPAESKPMEASGDASGTISLRSTDPQQQPATIVTSLTGEDALTNAPDEKAPPSDNASGRPATNTMRRVASPANALSGSESELKASNTPEVFVANDYVNPSSSGMDTMPLNATSPASSNERSAIDQTGAAEGYREEQPENRTASAIRSTTSQQPPRTAWETGNSKDAIPSSIIEDGIPSEVDSPISADLQQSAPGKVAVDNGQSNPVSPSRTGSSVVAEGNPNPQTAVSQAAFPEESRPSFQNSVELLAKGTIPGEATAGKNAPVTPETGERAARHTPLESSTNNVAFGIKEEKAVPVAQTSERSPHQEQGKEHTPSWFRNDVQTVTLNPNPSADKAAEPFSSYASSLTDELAQRIQELHRQKRHELTLDLQPEHLGRLRVRIGTDDNQVMTLISTESEQTKELLSRSSSALRQELASQGLVLEKLQIDVDSQATTQQQSFNRQGSGSRRNGSHQQTASTERGIAAPDARRTQAGHPNTLISLFV